MFDITAIGELLIDFTPVGISDKGNPVFEQNPGGAPANVLSAAAVLGAKTAFSGKVGNDQFGIYLKSVLDNIHVDTKGLVFSKEFNTTLAFVHINNAGDRSFSFYRKPGADTMLKVDEIDIDHITETKIFHFGSVTMTHEPSKSATLEAVRYARGKGIIISFDPNLRPPLWDDLETAKKTIIEGLLYTNILKISEEELLFLTGINDLHEGSKYLANQYGIKCIFITCGPKGCYYRVKDTEGYRNTYNVKTIDTTGAGDAFLGAVLYKLTSSEREPFEMSERELGELVDFGNAAGSLATTKKGAIPAMPSLPEIEKCINETARLEL